MEYIKVDKKTFYNKINLVPDAEDIYNYNNRKDDETFAKQKIILKYKTPELDYMIGIAVLPNNFGKLPITHNDLIYYLSKEFIAWLILTNKKLDSIALFGNIPSNGGM